MSSSPKADSRKVAVGLTALAAVSCCIALPMSQSGSSKGSSAAKGGHASSRPGILSALGGRGRVPSINLTNDVRSANAASSAEYERLVQQWREYMPTLRSPTQLRTFVKALISLKQKLKHGIALFDPQSSDEQLVRTLFGQHVVDHRELSGDLLATMRAFESFLAEQDRQILAVAGVSTAQSGLLKVTISDSWSSAGALDPVIALARFSGEALILALRDGGRAGGKNGTT
jgi:hypothetical protein